MDNGSAQRQCQSHPDWHPGWQLCGMYREHCASIDRCWHSCRDAIVAIHTIFIQIVTFRLIKCSHWIHQLDTFTSLDAVIHFCCPVVFSDFWGRKNGNMKVIWLLSSPLSHSRTYREHTRTVISCHIVRFTHFRFTHFNSNHAQMGFQETGNVFVVSNHSLLQSVSAIFPWMSNLRWRRTFTFFPLSFSIYLLPSPSTTTSASVVWISPFKYLFCLRLREYIQVQIQSLRCAKC